MSRVIVATLEEICCPERGAIISGPFGSNISSKYFVEKGIPVIRGNNLSLSLDKFYDRGFVFVTEEKADELNCYAEKMDLIFTSAGTIGQVGLIPEGSRYEKYVISNKQIRVRIDTAKVDILYAYYWFASPWSQKLLTSYNKGSTVPLLSLWEVKNLPITYPEDIEEQHKIAFILEILAKKIENNRNINNELELMVKTIYDYWFLQFEFPNEEGKPYKSSGGKMVWNEELEREIPEGWGSISIGAITNCFDTKRIPLSGQERKLKRGDIPYYGATGIMDYVDEAIFEGDYVLMAEDGSIMDENGHPILQRISGRAWVNNHAHVLQPSGKHCCKLLMLLLKNISVIKIKTGSVQMKINQENLNKIVVPNIPNDLIEKINLLLEPIDNKILHLKKETQMYISLRDFLLPLLMNGQVGFKN